MKLLGFVLILAWFAAAWFALGVTQCLAFISGAIITMLLATLIEFSDMEGE
jgi:urea transporter